MIKILFKTRLNGIHIIKRIIFTICFFLAFGFVVEISVAEKILVGETAWVKVEGTSYEYLARIDTGAQTTSIHAIDVRVINGSGNPEENVGKTVTFKTLNRKGESTVLQFPIIKVSSIKNSQGKEQRYVIELQLSLGDVKKNTLVNLRDRTKMKYKLLIGRSLLSKDFLVDVDLKAEKKGDE